MKKNLLLFLMFIAFIGCSKEVIEVSEIEDLQLETLIDGEKPVLFGFSPPDRVVKGVKGQTVSFSFHVQGRPTPTVTVQNPKGEIITSSDEHCRISWDGNGKGTVYIYDAQVSDSGQYMVKATNSLGTAAVTFRVSIRPK